MKTLKTCCLLIFVLAGMISCRKSSNVTPPKAATIQGKWKVVTDSLVTDGFGGPVTQVYQGVGSDYFNFTSDGKLYAIEGTGRDTATFTVADSVLNLDYSYGSFEYFQQGWYFDQFKVNKLDAHSAILKCSLTPPGIYAYYRTITLSR